MGKARFLTILLLLSLTAILLVRRGNADHPPPSVPLDRFPATLAQWTGQNVPIDKDVLEIMGKGVFLNRLYTQASQPPAGVSPGPIALFIAYFPTQRSGQSIHSPQNCLPGAGWTFESSTTTTFTDAIGHSHRVADFIITDGVHRDEALYWYQTHGRTLANDYSAKFAMLVDSIRYNRSDAALVRAITPIQANETPGQAHLRAVAFVQQLTPRLGPYIPD